MEHRYRQLMRRVRLYLLTEVRKKSWASKFLSARVFDSVYWSWDRQSVATGAAWGAAAAIAPSHAEPVGRFRLPVAQG